MEVQVEAKVDSFDGDQDDQVDHRQGSWRDEKMRGRSHQSGGQQGLGWTSARSWRTRSKGEGEASRNPVGTLGMEVSLPRKVNLAKKAAERKQSSGSSSSR